MYNEIHQTNCSVRHIHYESVVVMFMSLVATVAKIVGKLRHEKYH